MVHLKSPLYCVYCVKEKKQKINYVCVCTQQKSYFDCDYLFGRNTERVNCLWAFWTLEQVHCTFEKSQALILLKVRRNEMSFISFISKQYSIAKSSYLWKWLNNSGSPSITIDQNSLIFFTKGNKGNTYTSMAYLLGAGLWAVALSMTRLI